MRPNDLVVIEGAGSPAEINLGVGRREHVLAKLANADCLLAVTTTGRRVPYAVAPSCSGRKTKALKGV
jgi:hypothetical protein